MAGIFLLAAGVVMIGLGILQHRRSGNDPDPRNPDVTVMTSGIYRRTRNPIYIGYFIIVAGIGVWANSLWVLSTVLPRLLRGALGRCRPGRGLSGGQIRPDLHGLQEFGTPVVLNCLGYQRLA